ncbi:hypothetical protein ACFS6H_08645 [Terrimonas rubra]|uniref:Uncharacterized protein n=1 Tax=Terrimonas rubra TaxID=1035890 RepID=A0ABW6A599_9BACT
MAITALIILFITLVGAAFITLNTIRESKKARLRLEQERKKYGL